jgi:hypothetical protein
VRFVFIRKQLCSQLEQVEFSSCITDGEIVFQQNRIHGVNTGII